MNLSCETFIAKGNSGEIKELPEEQGILLLSQKGGKWHLHPIPKER